MTKVNENTLVEQPVIDWLRDLGYETMFSPDLAPGGAFMERNDYRDVILEGRFKRALKRINPNIPDRNLAEVADKIMKFDHPDLELGNKDMYKWLTQGVVTEVKDENGQTKAETVALIDFENIDNNEFLVVNQYTVQGKSVRIPDVVVFINGIPIAVFELKSPTRENATIVDAYSQIHDIYQKEIPKLFFYNQICVASDLWKAKHGTISSAWDYYSVWKGINSEDEDIKGKTELELLTKGIFQKQRLLDIIQNFIVFEADATHDATKYTKKMAMYNQYFGVNKAIDNTVRAVTGDKKIGVFWQTQGSGKSLAMVFYTGKVRKLEELNAPTVLFLTDRNDLDNQLYKTFLRCGYSTAKQTESIKDLESKLRDMGSDILFTLLQKFDLHKVLSGRSNVIVVADEAHRSEYALWAANVRTVLPNASFMGITGTPVELGDRNTRLVFGNHISKYPIDKSVKDGVTVPIYYEGRLTPLHVLNEFIDNDFDQLIEEKGLSYKEGLKKKLAKVEETVGSEDRLQKIAQDIVYHFNNRAVNGKAIVVTMSRRVAVRMYQIITSIKGAPEVAVVISNGKEFQGKIQKELDNKELEKRFKDPEDPLKMVIVCDMWLTGFDVPCLTTMYLDKPLKGHTLMQAVARVNRRYKDKAMGLIVDYIGVAENLKKALAIYTSDIQSTSLISIDELINMMEGGYEKVKAYFEGIDYKDWKKLEPAKMVNLFNHTINTVLTDPESGVIDEDKKKQFVEEEKRLYRLYCLVMPAKEAFLIREDIEFFEGVRRGMVKVTIIDPVYIDPAVEESFRKLISENIKAEGVIDIFAQYQKAKPDISILDDKFLEDAKNSHYKNLTIESVRKIIEGELKMRERTNIFRYRSLLEMLQKIIEEYENNVINSAKVIEKLLELAKEIKELEGKNKILGLSEEEMAFYDLLSESKGKFRNGDLKDLVKEIVGSVRKDISIDWTNKEVIKARIRSNVRLILLQHNLDFDQAEKITKEVYEQAVSLYQNYPVEFAT